MNESLFITLVEKYFKKVVNRTYETFNGTKKEPTLLHKTMLTEEYSADLTWGSNSVNHSVVAADYVSLDSSLPLKKRGSLGKAIGKLPKLGMKYRKDETDIDTINTMIAKGANEAAIVGKIFNDIPNLVKGADIRNEIAFQRGLSTGVTLAEDADNTGTGVRADFGYKAENQFKTLGEPWGAAGCTPQDDVQQLFDKAQEDGNGITVLLMSKAYFDKFRKSEQGKLLYSTFQNLVVLDKALLPTPSRKGFKEAIEDEYGCKLTIVDGAFKVEKPNGQTETVVPWAQPNVVGIPSENCGRLIYGTLAEETTPVAGVSYEKSGSFLLIKKYSKTDPLEEFSAAEARVLPVIDEGGNNYVLVANAKGMTLSAKTLAFPKSASNKTVTATTDDESVTATTDDDWLTLTVNGKTVTAAATANSAAEVRKATIEITSKKGYKAVVEVEQAAND